MKRCNHCDSPKPPEAFHRSRTQADGRHRTCAECVSAQKRMAYHADPEKFKARTAARRDPIKNAAAAAAWRRKNWERFKALKKSWRLRHREQRRPILAEAKRRYRQKYRARVAAYEAQYRRKNRDRINAHNRSERGRLKSRKASAIRRARKRAATIGPVDFKAIYKRDGGRCWICWRTLPLQLVHFDHVIPLAKGGEHSEDNLRVACQPCNDRKLDRLPTPALIVEIREEVLGMVA